MSKSKLNKSGEEGGDYRKILGYDRRMLRTRDLVLFLSVIVFLVGAITITLWTSNTTNSANNLNATIFNAQTATYTAEVSAVVDTKKDRLAILREKLKQRESISAEPEPIEETVTDVVETAATTSESVEVVVKDSLVKLCGESYSSKTIPGLTGTQRYVERVGQRVFYDEVSATGAPASVPVDASTTEPTATPSTVEQVIFILPLRTVPLSFTSCIKDDIVAISQTGLVIRNADYAKYQGSGEATLIGYTLDGFLLYGRTNSITTDACGGAVIDGSYRYYLSAERKAVIGCFAGLPVSL